MEGNIANAILIIGCLYFGHVYGFSIYHWLLILFAVATWLIPSGEAKDMVKAKIELLKAKAEYYKIRAASNR